MKKNVKNKILAFSMASAMIVPNVAVVFAEAPKAGLATVAKEASETKTIFVSYLEGAEWKASEQVEVPVDATAINTSLLKNVPAGYETCETGDLPLNGSDCININIRKKTTKTIYVSYIDEETSLPFANGIEQVEVAADATTFNTSALKNVPEGYVLCETGDVYFGDNDTPNVKVRKKAEEKKTINVTYFYVGENGENIPCGTDSVTLDASATTFNNTTLTNVPEGYEICRIGDESVGNIANGEFIYIEVREKAAQTRKVRVHYVSESGEMIEDNIEELTIPADQTVVKTADLKKIPAGYEVCAVGDINFSGVEDVNVEVRKKAAQTRTVYVHYIDAETKIPFENAIEKIEIPADEIHVNTSDLKEIPAGYEPVVTGDLDFYNTDDVNVELRKIEKVTTLHITFETVDGTVVGEKTFEKTSTDEEEVVFTLGDDIVLPEGYHFVNNGQIDYRKIKAGQTAATVMFVEQDETKTVLNVTFETKDGEVVGTTSAAKDFTVDEEGVKVATFVVGEDFALPEGYHFAEDVDQVNEITVNGLVGGHTVIVEKDAEPAPTPSEDPKKDDTKKEDPKKDDTKKEETKKPSKTADTADTSDVAAYAIPLVMSMVAISAIVVGRKKLS
ncbi:MAG: hypothetical protein UF329_01920 [Bulleidia sp.]|nr:hypothetical protein [Bulleidia sp.]